MLSFCRVMFREEIFMSLSILVFLYSYKSFVFRRRSLMLLRHIYIHSTLNAISLSLARLFNEFQIKCFESIIIPSLLWMYLLYFIVSRSLTHSTFRYHAALPRWRNHPRKKKNRNKKAILRCLTKLHILILDVSLLLMFIGIEVKSINEISRIWCGKDYVCLFLLYILWFFFCFFLLRSVVGFILKVWLMPIVVFIEHFQSIFYFARCFVSIIFVLRWFLWNYWC